MIPTVKELYPYKHCHDGWPGITDQPGYKPLNTPEELKILNAAHALKHRPIHPEIHDREARKWYGLPPCTCDSSEWDCSYYAARGL